MIPDYREKGVPGAAIANPQTDEQFVRMIEKSLSRGENVMIDESGMTPARKAHLQQVVENHPEWQGKVLW